MSQKSLDIIRGVAQAAANAYDGAFDSNGDPISLGLKREEGHPVLSSRDMDGFKVKMSGNHLMVNYQAEIKLRDVHNTKFEEELEQTVADIASWLKKEYKKVTGDTLSLTPVGEVDAIVQSTSKVRVFVNATKKFKVGGLEGVEDKLEPSEELVQKNFKDFLNQGGLGSRDAKNVTN
tara:strand:- start:735 stop:1265 length:531 start_codon:yes stop_codon:yes gene_type:complete